MEEIYLPYRSKILEIVHHTDIDYTFRMEFEGVVKPGQFFQVSIPKVGESPISVSEIGNGYVDLTIRRVGIVTDKIHTLKTGEYLFIRGPYGNGFDVELYKGMEIIVAAGGTGLAPVKGVIDYFAQKPEECKNFTVLMGFKSPADILFKQEIENWNKSIHTILTVDTAPEEYIGNKGLITNYSKDVVIEDVEKAQVIIVGPPIMMKFTVIDFLKRGIKEENIWVSYERKMSCGVGKCGHCRMDDTYICLSGPVFNFSKAKHLID